MFHGAMTQQETGGGPPGEGEVCGAEDGQGSGALGRGRGHR